MIISMIINMLLGVAIVLLTLMLFVPIIKPDASDVISFKILKAMLVTMGMELLLIVCSSLFS